MTTRVGILISGRGSNMRALVEAASEADFPAEVALVLSNRPDAAGLDFARARCIATSVVDHKAYKKDREGFERAMHKELQRTGVEFICLAGFMRLLTPWFIDQWHDRLINIHPSLLPSFKGLNTHERALEAGVKLHGCTVHFVRPDMDVGPIIAQRSVEVLDEDTPDTLGSRVLTVEHTIYPHALKQIVLGLEGGWTIHNERVIGVQQPD